MDHSAGDAMHHADQAPQGIQPGQKNIVGSATGVVRGVSEDGRAIVVDHGPIDGLGMGAMTMSFQLDDEATGGDVAVGDTVEFQVVEDGDDFRIIELSVR
ncbi:MAG: copper-binding protein [Pseudomonadota bacterium]